MPDPLYDKNCPLAHKVSVKVDFTIVCDGPECARGHQLSVSPFPLRNSCDFFLRRAMDILLGLPFIIVRIIVSFITVCPRCI